ncbi:MAG: LysE family transporter [Bacteroidaceae bacterium]|jgi:threonine/homoserine/homoserine lactone efflux protein|nr:LysE family transporter [Bacteroidaceae bacterium]MBR5891774.1 LysE family transporter [Bacteroidaceae bacterium]
MNEFNDFLQQNNFLQQLVAQMSVLEIVVKGLLIGIVASAPMGPVGVLCVQRTLNKGRIYGFVTGCGAAVSDIIYALVTGYGLSFIYDFIHNERNLFWLQLAGSVMLFFFGIYTYRSNPAENTHKVSRNRSNLIHNGLTGFFITLSNPLIIFLFLAMFTPLSFMLPDLPFYEQALGYLSILGGAVLWWLFITYAVNKLKNRFDVRGIWIINRVIGAVVIAAAFISMVLLLTGIYSFH